MCGVLGAAQRPQLALLALVSWHAKAGSSMAIEFEQGTGEPVPDQPPAPRLLPPTLSPPHSAQVQGSDESWCTKDTRHAWGESYLSTFKTKNSQDHSKMEPAMVYHWYPS